MQQKELAKVTTENEQMAILENVNLFGDIVSRNYLSHLGSCEIIPLNKDIIYSPIRWYGITKIVLEKNTFFPDRLSMLYISLHQVARNVILVVNKNKYGKIELFLGARDFSGNLNASGDILGAGLQGFLPGIKTKRYTKGTIGNQSPGNQFDRPYVSSVSGLASLRDDKKESFVQGIDKLINATSQIPMFTAFFVAENVSNEETQNIISAFNDLHGHLSPMAETQLTISESDTTGTSETISENFSRSISKSLSHTITNSVGFNVGKTKTVGKSEGTSTNKSTNILRSMWSGLVGGKTGSSENSGWNESDAFQTGLNIQKSIAKQTGGTDQEQKGGGKSSGTIESTTKGESRQITFKNNHVKGCLDVLEVEIKRLRTGMPFGLWSTAAYFLCSDSTTATQMANLYRGCIVGEESSAEACGINVWRDENDARIQAEYLSKGLLPRYNYKGVNVSAGSIVTSKELAIHLSLPQSSVPGILVREEQSFGRNVVTDDDLSPEKAIEIGVIKHLGEEYTDEKIMLSINGLSKHTFVTGTTGSGKSNTLYLLVSKLRERGISILIIEPAKGEYKEVFGSMDDFSVYGSNPRVSDILCINPFEFPEGIDVYEHIDALVEIFNACWPMYAAMPQVLKHSIIEAYKACGWNLTMSYNPNGIFPTIEDVLDCLKEYINSSEYSADTKGDYKGSLETRLQSLCEGIVGRMFNGKAIQSEDLFSKNVIIDLSRIKSSETKSLLMGLLVMKLNEFRMSEHKGMNLPLRHITVLEEAHNLLKRTSTTQSAESSNVAGMAVERIASSMAEMRTYGEGFVIVDQSPSMLDLAAIRNTNTKIVMALPEKEDREVAGKALGLDDSHVEEISRLKTGEAIIYQTAWEESVKGKISMFEIDETKAWEYVPESLNGNDTNDAMRKVYDILCDAYASIDHEFSRIELLSLLEKGGVSGGRINKVKEKVNSVDEPSDEDIAYIFATIIGSEIFDSAKAISDVDVFNSSVIRSLSHKLGKAAETRVKTYLNMYLKGCSISANNPFYEGWLQDAVSRKE